MTTKMTDKDTLCKFQNTGYCKYQDKCKYKHVTEKCGGNCDRKSCQKRHQRQCKFSIKCKRQNSCQYLHQTSSEDISLKAEIQKLTATINEVVAENKTMKAKLAHLEKELKKSLEDSQRKDNSIKEVKEENKSIKTKIANFEKDIEKKFKEKDTVIKEVVEQNKAIKTKIIKFEKDMKTNPESTAEESDSSIENVVVEFLNKTIKSKVVSLEEQMKTAVERIVNELKALKVENNKRNKEIKALREEADKNKRALVDGLQPSTGMC